MNDSMGPMARALLEGGRDGDEPTTLDEQRIRDALNKRLGVALGAASVTAASGAALGTVGVAIGARSLSGAGVAGLGAGLGAGLIGSWALAKFVGVLLVASLAGGAWAVWSQTHHAALIVPSLPARDSLEQARMRLRSMVLESGAREGVEASEGMGASGTLGSSGPLGAVGVVASEAVAEAMPAVVDTDNGMVPSIAAPRAAGETSPRGRAGSLPSGGLKAAAAGKSKAASAPTSASDALLEQITLLHRARTEMREGRLGLALTHLDEHERRYPRSPVAEERTLVRVLTLCALGRVDEATRDGRRLLSSNPRSVYAERIERSCVGTGSPGTTP